MKTRQYLLNNGFSDEVWMKRTWSDEETGYNFTLSIEPKSMWATLSQTGQGFTVHDVSKMADIKPDDKLLMADNTIALQPFKSCTDIEMMWQLLTNK